MESNEFCDQKLPFIEGSIKKKEWGIFHEVFLTGCLKQFEELSKDKTFHFLLNYLQNAEKQVAIWKNGQ